MRTRLSVVSSPRNDCSSFGTYSSTISGSYNPRLRQVWNPITGKYEMWPDPRPFSFGPYTNVGLEEYASDLVLKNTRSSWNKFEHYKCSNWYSLEPAINGTWMYLANASAYDRINIVPGWALCKSSAFGSRSRPFLGLPLLLSATAGEIVSPPPALNSLVSDSLKAMLPGIKPQLSLVNSIIELKDFKKLPATIIRLKSMIKRSTTLRKILGGSADAYLQKEFNIMPLLSDISGFRRALINTSKQVKNLLDLEGKRLTRHYYRGLESSYPNVALTPNPNIYTYISPSISVDGVYQVNSLNGTFKAYRKVTCDKARFHGEIQYSYYLTQFQRENATILGLADALGVNLNPSIIWNAIPWSFVVDWVIGIGRWLDQFKVRNLEPVTVIHRYLWSIEVKRSTEISVETNLGVATLPKPMVRASKHFESAYRRDLYNVGLSTITSSGFSLKEFTLASALGLSRMH